MTSAFEFMLGGNAKCFYAERDLSSRQSVIDADNDQGDNSIRPIIRDGKFVLELK